MKWFACAAVMLMLVSGPAVAQPASDQFLISPGVGIGPVKLGMSITDVAKILGTPKPASTKLTSIVLPIPEGAMHFWWSPATIRPGVSNDNGFGVIASKDGMIYEVKSPFDDRYHVTGGPRVGSRIRDVSAVFGDPSRQVKDGGEAYYIYDRLGVAFLIQDDKRYTNYGLVNGVWVFAPQAGK